MAGKDNVLVYLNCSVALWQIIMTGYGNLLLWFLSLFLGKTEQTAVGKWNRLESGNITESSLAICQLCTLGNNFTFENFERPLDCKEIISVHPKGNQSWIFIGRTDAEAETSILWPPDAKNLLTGKAPDAGKDWRQEEKGTTEDKMVGWHHQLDGHECEQAPGVDDRQGSLACCSPWGLQRVGNDWATELNLLYWPEVVILY